MIDWNLHNFSCCQNDVFFDVSYIEEERFVDVHHIQLRAVSAHDVASAEGILTTATFIDPNGNMLHEFFNLITVCVFCDASQVSFGSKKCREPELKKLNC